MRCTDLFFFNHGRKAFGWWVWPVPKGKISMAYSFNQAYRPPLPSRATRTPPARSKASSRGLIVAQLPADPHPQRYWFESKLEQRVFFLLAARRDTYSIWEQPPPIRYRDCGSRLRTHYFDFLLTQTSGRRIAIAVKAAGLVKRHHFRDTLALIRAATPLSYADDVVLITDRSFTRADARNAERLHAFRRTPDIEADTIVADLLRHLSTETRIATLVEATALGGRGFRAVFRALFAGLARVTQPGDIRPGTHVIAGEL